MKFYTSIIAALLVSGVSSASVPKKQDAASLRGTDKAVERHLNSCLATCAAGAFCICECSISLGIVPPPKCLTVVSEFQDVSGPGKPATAGPPKAPGKPATGEASTEDDVGLDQ